MPRDKLLQIESADGTIVDVPEFLDTGEVDEEGNPILETTPSQLWADTWARVDSQEVVARVRRREKPGMPQRLIVPDASMEEARDAQAASDKARDDAREARIAVVTIDDGVMAATVEPVELQGPPSAADLATVKARQVARQGIANPSHVRVETLADYRARIAE